MTNYRLSRSELIGHLVDQIDFMIASAISYDKGFEGEAKRLAAAIRILLHDASQCSALLTQLHKMDILFYDSASVFDPSQPLPSSCLTLIRLSKKEMEELKGDYVAPLDGLPPSRRGDKRISFDRWWRKNIILKDAEINTFTRRDLVRTVANKEGGAHVDPKLDQAYASLAKFNSMGWKVYVHSKDKEFENSPVLPSIRQITHEILKTLKDGTLDLFADENPIIEKFMSYQNHCQTVTKTPIKEV
jgi:hypothetical protein